LRPDEVKEFFKFTSTFWPHHDLGNQPPTEMSKTSRKIIFLESKVTGGPISLVSTTEELLERKVEAPL
jgi:hypothetical protein